MKNWFDSPGYLPSTKVSLDKFTNSKDLKVNSWWPKKVSTEESSTTGKMP